MFVADSFTGYFAIAQLIIFGQRIFLGAFLWQFGIIMTFAIGKGSADYFAALFTDHYLRFYGMSTPTAFTTQYLTLPHMV